MRTTARTSRDSFASRRYTSETLRVAIGSAVTRVSLGSVSPTTHGKTPDPEAARAGSHVDWGREGAKALAPHSTGVYANFLSDEGAAGVRAAYGDRLDRLVALKTGWDPSNFFRLNANIPPR